MNTHYAPKQPIMCEGPGECQECRRRKKAIWHGYAPVLAWDAVRELWHPFVLELTGCLEEQLRGRQLRGELWKIERNGKGAINDPLAGEYLEKRSGSLVIAPFDIEPVLKRMYHVFELKIGIPNTMPARVVLPAIAGEGPATAAADAAGKDQAAADRPKESFRSMRERFERRQRGDVAGEDVAGEERNGEGENHHTNGRAKR